MEGFCRGCLNKYNDPTDLLQYCESNRRLFVYSTGLQVKRNDTFTFQLCKECHFNMKLSCKFKKQCRNSDKKFKSYLALKENEVGTDFSAYLKIVDDTLALRVPIPVASRITTPANQRADEDDNESTCTSIQNFMTDMLQGEEMPPTEARIIREVIQEEADILDDSLDSHWLQDDVSVDHDFGLDLSLGAFSTPRSQNNDHSYTPRRFTDEKEDHIFYDSTEKVQRPNNTDVVPNDMPILEDGSIQLIDILNNKDISGVDINYSVKNATEARQPNETQNDMPLLDCTEFDDAANNTTLSEIDVAYCVKNSEEPAKEVAMNKIQENGCVQSKDVNIAVEDNIFETLESFNDNLLSVNNDISPFVNSVKAFISREENTQDSTLVAANENEFSIIVNTGIANKKVKSFPLTRHLACNVDKSKLQSINEINTIIDKSQSPFTKELKQFLNKAKSSNPVIVESDISNKEITFITGSVKSINKKINNLDSRQEANVENIDSPLKDELEQYINKKAELKKNILVLNVNQINDSIDKNLELALRNDDSQEFSLDKLLVSPQKSIQSGASTPTINNILFGSMTPKNKDINIEIDETDIIKVLSKNGGTQSASLNISEEIGSLHKSKEIESLNKSKKIESLNISKEIGSPNESKELQYKQYNIVPNSEKGVDEVDATNALEEFLKDNNNEKQLSEELNTIKRPYTRSKGYKNVKKMKASYIYDETNNKVLSNLNSESSKEAIKLIDDTILLDDDENISNTESETGNNAPIGFKEEAMDGMGENDDISLTNLLNYDGDTVDLNISICSEFLKDKPEGKADDVNDPLENPSSPIDDKYDLFERLCKICDKIYASQKVLKMHFRNIHKVKITQKIPVEYKQPKICQHCGKSFRDKSNLNKHIKRHHEGPDSYKCDICTLTFKTKGGLSKHMSAHKDLITKGKMKITQDAKTNEKFVCTTCGKVSTSVNSLKIHTLRHTKSYKFNCTICSKGFYRACDLETHMDTHTKTFNFACEYCPKVYKRRALLIGHMYRHLNMTKFECNVCKSSFITNHLLKQHYRSLKCIENRRKLSENKNGNEVDTVTTVVKKAAKNNKNVEVMETEDEHTDAIKGNMKIRDEDMEVIDEDIDIADEN